MRSAHFILVIIAALCLSTPDRGAAASQPSRGAWYERAVAFHARGLELEQQGSFLESAEHYGQGAVMAAQEEELALTAALLLAAGSASEKAGQIQGAIGFFEEGLRALAERAPDVDAILTELMTAEKNVGAGELAVPDDLYTPATAAELDAAERDPLLHVKLLIGAGNAYLGQSQMEVALNNFYIPALRLGALDSEPLMRARLLTNAGIALRRLGRFPEAGEKLAEALDLFFESGEDLASRSALAALAAVRLETHQIAEAENAYRRAIELYEAANDQRGLGRAITGLARTALLTNRIDEAKALFRKAERLAETNRDAGALIHIYLGLGVANRRLGHLDEAGRSLEKALPLIEARRGELRTDEGKIAFFDSAGEVYDALLEVHLDRAKTEPDAWKQALHVSELSRGRALEELIGYRRRQPMPELQIVLPSQSEGEPLPLDPIRMDRQGAVGTPNDLPQNAIPPWAQMAMGVPSGGWEFVPENTNPSRLVDLREPQPLTQLSFHVLEESTAVFLVKANGSVRGRVVPLGREELEREIGALRASLRVDTALRGVRGAQRANGQPQREAHTILSDLYRELISPFAADLPIGDSPLALIPDGPLWNLPFAALMDEEGNSLISRRPLLFSSSARFLDEIRREKPRDIDAFRFLIVGNPYFGNIASIDSFDFYPLPGAEAEARAIAHMIPHAERVHAPHGQSRYCGRHNLRHCPAPGNPSRHTRSGARSGPTVVFPSAGARLPCRWPANSEKGGERA